MVFTLQSIVSLKWMRTQSCSHLNKGSYHYNENNNYYRRNCVSSWLLIHCMVVPLRLHEQLPHFIWGLNVVSIWHDNSYGNINSNRWKGYKLGEFLPREVSGCKTAYLFFCAQPIIDEIPGLPTPSQKRQASNSTLSSSRQFSSKLELPP